MNDDTTVLSKRRGYDVPVLWVCVPCKISEQEHIQPRCPRCLNLMEEAKKV
jgi:hypothetical protein